MTRTATQTHDQWRNIEIRITYPVPHDGYDLNKDRRFENLADTVMHLYPKAVMSGMVVWSDADDAA